MNNISRTVKPFWSSFLPTIGVERRLRCVSGSFIKQIAARDTVRFLSVTIAQCGHTRIVKLFNLFQLKSTVQEWASGRYHDANSGNALTDSYCTPSSQLTGLTTLTVDHFDTRWMAMGEGRIRLYTLVEFSKIPVCAALLFLLSACAVSPVSHAMRNGEMEVASGRYEEGLKILEDAAIAPGAPQDARAILLRNRAYALDRIEKDAHLAMEEGRLDAATALFTRMRRLDAERSDAGVRQVKILRDVGHTIEKAETALRAGEVDKAQALVKVALNQDPYHRQALALAARIAEKLASSPVALPELGPEYKKHITLEFRDVSLKSLFDALWHASGINFVLDKDVHSDVKTTIMVKDVSVEEAVDAILATQQMAKRVLGPKMLYIYPRTPQKTGDYQELLIRNFFLSNVTAKEMQSLLKEILKTKEIYADEKRNLIVVRDTPEKVALAEKLIQAQDQPEPEVMLAVDVIEINRSKLQDMGVVWPQQLEFGVANPITLQSLTSLSSAGINVGVGGLANSGSASGVLAQLNLAMNMGDTKTLANPRIRVRNREKAKIHIGDRLPVVTTTTMASSTPYYSENVSYLDVGLKLEVEPEVLLDNDVVIKLNMEVSSATQDKANSKFYDVGTRNTSTVLTIRDGETQILAGLIRDDEADTTTGIPGLGNLPLIGRLFSSNQSNKAKSEILLAITPHVLRNLHRPAPALMEYLSGSETGSSGASSTSVPSSQSPQVDRPAYRNAIPEPVSSPGSGPSIPNLNSTFSSPNPITFSTTSVPNTGTGSTAGNSGGTQQGAMVTPPSNATSNGTSGSVPAATGPSTPNAGVATGATGGDTQSIFDLPPGVGSTPGR